MKCDDTLQTHYYRDIEYTGATPEEKAIEELQKEVEEIQVELANTEADLTQLTTDFNSFKDKFVIVYPTDTDAVVQQKINTPGISKIIFAKGTYNNITSTKTIPSNKTLIGYGATIVAPSSIEWIVFQNDSDGSVGGYNANSNINILGFEFNGENLLSGQGASIIGFLHCNHILIKDCKFSHLYSGGHFIEFNATTASTISDCYFYDYTGSEMVQLDKASGVGAYPVIPNGPWDGTGCSAITICNNTFENDSSYTAEHGASTDCLPAGIGNHNLGGNHISHIKMVNNTFANMTTAFRFVELFTSVISNNTAYGGYNFFSCGSDTAAVTGTLTGNIITNNVMNARVKSTTVTVEDSYTHGGIYYNGSNTVIANNYLWNYSADGMQIRGRDIIIDGNRVADCGRCGILLVTTTGISVTNNHCTGNNILKVVSNDADIRESGTSNCNITGNTANTIYTGTDSASTMLTSNIATSSLTKTGSASSHGNVIAGVWTA